MVRYLRYMGYQVLYVQNITDVGHILDSGEDRIVQGARREQMQPMQLAEHYTRRYFADMDRLNVLDRTFRRGQRATSMDDRLDTGTGRWPRLCVRRFGLF